MSKVEKISIALPREMVEEVKAAVEDGEYSTASEVVREALRDWRLKRKVEALHVGELKRLLREGMDSGPSIDAVSVFARLRTRYSKTKKSSRE